MLKGYGAAASRGRDNDQSARGVEARGGVARHMRFQALGSLAMASAIARLYGAALRRVIRHTFPVFERLGIHISPVHYHHPIPHSRTLVPELWLKRSALVGVDMAPAAQLELLETVARCYRNEYCQFPQYPTGVPHQYYLENPAFVAVDAELLYCVIRHFRPRRILEIGSGNTTYLAAQAVLKNNDGCELAAIEPFPNEVLRRGFAGLSRLISKPVQEVPLDEFTRLESGDVLFIDSSHILNIGSDVQYEFLEIIPRLASGVLIHVHDIFFPGEYPRDWVKREHWFFNEQYLLQAFLAFNPSFQVLWSGSYMHTYHAEALAAAIPSYSADTLRPPGSFWMRRK